MASHAITEPRQSIQRAFPRGWRDFALQLAIFFGIYGAYELVRGIVGSGGYTPFGNATKIINTERTLHVFIEPTIQHWVQGHAEWLIDVTSWSYIYCHLFVTLGVLLFIYFRRNSSYYFVRNMFIVSMAIALLLFSFFPTAPPRLMPQWGFFDAIQQYTGVTVEHGSASVLMNDYASVPSMHIAFALMISIPMTRLVRNRIARALWYCYAPYMVFVVVVTGNHYLTDAFLGAVTAGISALAARHLFAPKRPEHWSFAGIRAYLPPSLSRSTEPSTLST